MILQDSSEQAANATDQAAIRPIQVGDLPQVLDLYRRVFGTSRIDAPARAKAHATYLEEIFFGHPWIEKDLPSLVYQDRGRIIGCLGVMPRRMSIGGRPLRAAVSHHFMVDPERRSTLAGVSLLRAFFAGPQDLSLAEGNTASRKIWEALGGTTALLYSLRWVRPLRPSRYLLACAADRGLPGAVDLALRPLCRMVDTAASGISHRLFRFRTESREGAALSADDLLGRLGEFSRGRALRPEYDEPALRWLLGLLGRKKGRGTLRYVAVHNPQGARLGWYLYYVNPGGMSEVLQLVATRETARDVLGHLFADAWRRGAVAVSGQLDPPLMPAFVEANCHYRGGSWMLAHSAHHDVLHALHAGDAFFSRLEGEWWIGLQGGWV
ncbi:MAG: GNAT family N-acetyltransferase [Nitrospiria bacterium]